MITDSHLDKTVLKLGEIDEAQQLNINVLKSILKGIFERTN